MKNLIKFAHQQQKCCRSGGWALAANPFAATRFAAYFATNSRCKLSFSLHMVTASGFAASVLICCK